VQMIKTQEGRFMRNSILIAILLTTSQLLVAQSRNYNIYNISVENGLPTNDLQFVYQDSFGFLWVASYEGVFRWDGYGFKKYHHNEKDSTSLDHNIVYSIFEDSKKRLWVGTIEGLNLYDRETDGFIKCVIGQKNQKIPVNAIQEDSKKQLWLGTSVGLCKYDHEKKTSEWHQDQNAGLIFCMTIDDQDNIWTGTFNGGVTKFSQSTKTFEYFSHQGAGAGVLSSNNIKSIFCDDKNNIWVGTTDKGITVLDASGKFVRNYTDFAGANNSVQNTINCFYQDKNNMLWIGVGRGSLYYIDSDTQMPKPLTKTILNSNRNQFTSVTSIHEDSFGNIWFATAGNGLFYTNVNKNVFENYLQDASVLKGLKTSVITCFYEDAKGNTWIGTERSGFIKANIRENSFTLFSSASHALSNDAITDIKGDATGKLWMTTWNGGVMVFDPLTQQIKKFLNNPADPNSLPINDAKVLLQDDTLVWIGTHGEGLAAYDKKRNTFIHNRNNHVFPFQMSQPGWINHLFKDSSKRLWVATYSGLFMYDGQELKHYEHTSDTTSISSNSVNMVTEDQKGRIWIISEAGLDEFNIRSENFIRYNQKISLPETMKAIVVDKENKLWISSNEGIVSLDPQNLTIKRYDASDGLQGNSFFHKAVLRNKNDQLYFGGPHGFNVFHPDSLKGVNSIPSYFYTTDLYVYNKLQVPNREDSPLSKVLSLTNKLTLKPDQSFFSIEVAAVNLYSPAKTRYAYKLEGLHDQWINLENERKISVTDLNDGSYTLKVKYTGIDGEWHDGGKDLRIIVLPPWYKTLWFKFVTLLFISGSIVAIFYIRVASIKQRNRILKAEVAKRTHELSEANSFLVERNEEIKLQKERLEEFNDEILRQSEKILDQQRHITEQNHELEITVDELQKLNKTKDHFFSILAHDLKNPISALTGISDFMKNNFLKLEKKDALEYLNSIHKSSNAVYDLLINLLNWSRTQSKNIEYTPVDFNIRELLQKNVTLLEQQFNNKHISLSMTSDAAHNAFADYNMIDTVIRNIISNSIKFTEYNGSITISSTETEENVEIKVSDTGVGMTRDQLQKLFSLDKNNISVGTAGEKGTGLGLVISQEFININRGQIKVESQPGKGTDFYVILPKSVANVKAQLKVQRPSARHEKLSPDFWENFPVDKLIKVKGKKILIVDDNAELRTYLRLLLSGTFEIFEASNGQEGLQLALEVQPTAIVSDLIMPVMNGLEFCREIKNSTSTSHIPVILLTSQWEEKSQLSGYEAGADIYLTKPVKKELFIQVILNFIQNQEKLRQKIQETLLSNNAFQEEEIPLNKLDEEFLKRLVEFIESNIADPNIDSRSICEEIGMSRTVLYAKIKSLTGQSVHEFIKSIRLKRSIKLLLDGTLNISQIALEVGFNSHSYFDKCFVKQYGVGPKEYLARRRNMKIG
jgi:ligand-binding sensor domain-containing protein/signal transduction histidine kinase/CheY-like chemotaxis protein/AraC-like DNA-binding protein